MHHGTHERWWFCCNNRFRVWESKTNFDMENYHLGSHDDSIRVRPNCGAIWEDPTVPHKPSCRGKLFSVWQRIGGAIGDCQTENDNAVPQNFAWVLLGVEASKTDVQLLSKALIFELCKIVDNLSKRCEYHSTCGSPKKGGTNYSEGPSKRFNILLYRFAFRTNTEILKTDKLQNVQYLKGDASTEGDECVTSYLLNVHLKCLECECNMIIVVTYLFAVRGRKKTKFETNTLNIMKRNK